MVKQEQLLPGQKSHLATVLGRVDEVACLSQQNKINENIFEGNYVLIQRKKAMILPIFSFVLLVYMSFINLSATF